MFMILICKKVILNMNRYIVLEKIVEVGSFTKAAELLWYTQPALSQMIVSLERVLQKTNYQIAIRPKEPLVKRF